MKIVIQCAGRKSPRAGSLVTPGGQRVIFVGDTATAPPQDNAIYARPDDPVDNGDINWRDQLVAYNRDSAATNPYGLLPAYRLYTPPCYQGLVDTFGVDKIFILSAGWGLIPATFLTPDYDITFSAAGLPHTRRHKGDRYDDFRLMNDDGDDVVFLGGQSYVPLFDKLTHGQRGQRAIFYNARAIPDGLSLDIRTWLYETPTRTNWHYECAKAMIDGRLRLVFDR